MIIDPEKQESKQLVKVFKSCKGCWQGGQPWQQRWMAQLGRVMYLVERYKKINAAAASAEVQVRLRALTCLLRSSSRRSSVDTQVLLSAKRGGALRKGNTV